MIGIKSPDRSAREEIEKEVEDIQKNAIYQQIDNVIKILKLEGVEILTINDAIKKYSWIGKYIKKPLSGYFIRVRGMQKAPISTCFLIDTPNIKQHLTNVIVVEENAKVTFRTLCAANRANLSSVHTDYTKLILKENAEIRIEHLHRWGTRDFVSMALNVEMGKNSKLEYVYRSLESPKKLYSVTKGICEENATAKILASVVTENSIIKINDEFWLIGDKSSAVIKFRVAGREKGYAKTVSKIVAEGGNTKGHLDCQGLMISENSELDMIPELISRNKTATLTHEASIGRITEDVLTYLKARGLTESSAIDLIVAGFLATNV